MNFVDKIKNQTLRITINTALKLPNPELLKFNNIRLTVKQGQQIKKIISRYKIDNHFFQMIAVVFNTNTIEGLSRDQASWCNQVLHNLSWIIKHDSMVGK